MSENTTPLHIVSFEEVCQRLRYTVGTGRNLIWQKRFPIPYRKFGGKTIIRNDDLEAFIRGRPFPSEIEKAQEERRGPGRPRKVAPQLTAPTDASELTSERGGLK